MCTVYEMDNVSYHRDHGLLSTWYCNAADQWILSLLICFWTLALLYFLNDHTCAKCNWLISCIRSYLPSFCKTINAANRSFDIYIYTIYFESIWSPLLPGADVGILFDHQCQWFMTVLAYWQSHESASCLRLISPDVNGKSYWVLFQYKDRLVDISFSHYKNNTAAKQSHLDYGTAYTDYICISKWPSGLLHNAIHTYICIFIL